MTTQPLAIRTRDGHRVVAAQSGGSIPPGLALTLVPMDFGLLEDTPGRATDERWSITHQQSGRRIGPGFEARRDAQRIAESLAPLADWERPSIELRATPGLETAVRETLDRALTALDAGSL